MNITMDIASQQGYKMPNTAITQTNTQVHICLLTYHDRYIHTLFQMFSYISEKSRKHSNNTKTQSSFSCYFLPFSYILTNQTTQYNKGKKPGKNSTNPWIKRWNSTTNCHTRRYLRLLVLISSLVSFAENNPSLLTISSHFSSASQPFLTAS